jgi:hypothetical protein
VEIRVLEIVGLESGSGLRIGVFSACSAMIEPTENAGSRTPLGNRGIREMTYPRLENGSWIRYPSPDLQRIYEGKIQFPGDDSLARVHCG